MVKTYKTIAHSAVIQVDTKDGVRQVTLANGFIDDHGRRGGVFATDDAELQKGIERHPRFKSGFYDQIWTDDVEVKKAVKAESEAAEVKEEENGK